MNLYIASDHAGYEFKTKIIEFMSEKFNDYNIFDCGTYSEDAVHYPEYAEKVCVNVLSNDSSLGILICGTGIGMSICANKISGIRAALCNDTLSSKLSREHNDANVLVLGAKIIGFALGMDIITNFLNSKFEGGRHNERLNLITDIENRR